MMEAESNRSISESSVLSISTTTNTTQSVVRRGKSATTTWLHSREPRPEEPGYNGRSRILYCKYCPNDSPYGSSVTTNFRKHLESKHGTLVAKDLTPIKAAIAEDFAQLYQRSYDTGQAQEIEMKVFEKTLNPEMINEALVSLIVVRNLPFRIVQWPEFHTFCMTLNPKVLDHLTTTHSTIPTLIDNSWQVQRDIVRKKLQSAPSSIHLSLDIWTSPNRLLLLGICAHFVDQPYEKHRKALLALRPVASHAGDEQCTILLSVLKEYGIVRQVDCHLKL